MIYERPSSVSPTYIILLTAFINGGVLAILLEENTSTNHRWWSVVDYLLVTWFWRQF